jgi:hydrogenase maturation protease
MTTKKQIEQELIEVLVPGIGRNIVQLNMIRGIEVINDMVKITLANTALSSSAQDWVRTKTKAVVEGLREVNNVEVEFIECKLTELNQINHVIAVMSGNGGVGKSLIASLMAVALNHQGNEVGILDADITGPSIPKMFGLSTRPGGSDTGILPVVTRSGIEIISINLLLPQEDDAVIWRGPLISKAITQFWEEVVWGRLDYLVVDLPPGTADASLTVMQTLPISGVIIVFTPQDLTAMVVRKAVNMLQKMEKTILGVVENMSYLYIPEIDKRIELFGKSRGEEMAQVTNSPFLGQLPIDPELARLCDEGTIESYHSDAFVALSQAFVQALPKTKIEQ